MYCLCCVQLYICVRYDNRIYFVHVKDILIKDLSSGLDSQIFLFVVLILLL